MNNDGRTIGVVGNRYGWSYEEVKKKLDELEITPCDMIVSGGAIGVDSFAQRYAEEKGVFILIAYPDMNVPSPRRYYERNDLILEMCEILVAFQKDDKHSGTQYTINRGKRKKNMKVIVVRK